MTDSLKPKILVVDDDVNILTSTQRLLAKAFRVDTASSGKQGLEKIHDQGPYAIVISDLMMPEMDGIEFLYRVEKTSPDSIRIMLTGHATLERAIEAINEGHIFLFLTKPISQVSLRKALGRSLHYYELKQSQRELRTLRKLKEAFTGVVTGLAAVVESRDRYTAGHQARVAKLAVLIAERMELSQDRVEGVRIASLVHDIGKIYVPAEFLCKTGTLTNEEMALIRTHPKVGHDILSPMDFHWPISEIVLQHHEKMDGTGYPRRLSGDGIILEARIIVVADTVDAIISDRPYRRGFDEETAVMEITQGKGEIYDETVSDCFLQIARELKMSGGISRLLSME